MDLLRQSVCDMLVLPCPTGWQGHRDAKPNVKVTKEAAKDLVERKGALWWLNPLCGGKDALLEPLFITERGGLG